MKVKIVLTADKSGEMAGRKVTIERNNADFETIFKDLLASWLEIDFERSHTAFQRDIVDIASKYLERPHLGWILKMVPKDEGLFK